MSRSIFGRSDLIYKVEQTSELIKHTKLVEKDFEIINENRPKALLLNIFLSIMSDNSDIRLNQITGEPIFNSLIYSTDKMLLKTKVAIILGKYAESLLVMKCNEKERYNRHFARIARNNDKNSTNNYLNNFTAISTGAKSTKENYRYHYNPSDGQRDIVWVDDRYILKLLTLPKKNGALAGLQLKVSYDWKNLTSSLTQYHHPILYFGMNDDWDDLNNYINTKKKEGREYDHVHLVPIDDHSNQILDMLYDFEKILVNLIEGKISLEYLIDKSIQEEDSSLVHALTKTSGTLDYCLIPDDAVRKAKELEDKIEKYKNATTFKGNYF